VVVGGLRCQQRLHGTGGGLYRLITPTGLCILSTVLGVRLRPLSSLLGGAGAVHGCQLTVVAGFQGAAW